MSYTIRLPPIDELALRWGEIDPLARRATNLSVGCYEPVDILGLVMTARLSLLIAENGSIAGFAGVDVIEFPRRRAGRIAWMAGDDMAAWGDAMIAALEGHARSLKCDLMIASGRTGWERVALRYGYAPSVMGLVKSL